MKRLPLLLLFLFAAAVLRADALTMERLRREERTLTLEAFKALYKERLRNQHQMLRKYWHLRTRNFTDETLPAAYAALADGNRTAPSSAIPRFSAGAVAFRPEEGGKATTSAGGEMPTASDPTLDGDNGTGGVEDEVSAPAAGDGLLPETDSRIRTGVASPWARKR